MGDCKLAARGQKVLRVVQLVPSRAQHPADSCVRCKIWWEGHYKLCDFYIDEFNTDSGLLSVRILEDFRKPEDLKCA